MIYDPKISSPKRDNILFVSFISFRGVGLAKKSRVGYGKGTGLEMDICVAYDFLIRPLLILFEQMR